jgi:DNA processing protein
VIGVRRRAPDKQPRPVPARPGADERAHWIAFSLVPGLGPVGFAVLLRRHGSAAAAWAVGRRALAELPRMPGEALEAFDVLSRIGVKRTAARTEAATQRAGGRVVTPLDADYPRALREVEPRPAVLHVMGDAEALRTRSVAVVGTRRPSGYGLSVAIDIGDELARAGSAVVSGLAIGIDGAAHRAALAAGARTVAVLPSPLDRIYPPRHRALARDIVRGGGALVTELAVGRRVGRPDFARRNRIIAALSEAVVVVEAPDRSGALLTAAAATALDRELYAVPGPIDAVASRGCNRLIADQHAMIVTSVVALMHQIGLHRGSRPPSVQALSDAEGALLAHLLRRSGSIEELIDRTRLDAGSVASGLTMLEARGLVSAFGGSTFHPTLAARRLARVV